MWIYEKQELGKWSTDSNLKNKERKRTGSYKGDNKELTDMGKQKHCPVNLEASVAVAATWERPKKENQEHSCSPVAIPAARWDHFLLSPDSSVGTWSNSLKLRYSWDLKIRNNHKGRRSGAPWHRGWSRDTDMSLTRGEGQTWTACKSTLHRTLSCEGYWVTLSALTMFNVVF